MASPSEILNKEHDETLNAKKVTVVDASGNATSSTPSSIGDGLKLITTAGTREALASSTACRSVVITAKQTNTNIVAVGGSTVVAASGATRRGTPLNAGDSIAIDIDDLSKVYIDAIVDGEGVTYTYTA